MIYVQPQRVASVKQTYHWTFVADLSNMNRALMPFQLHDFHVIITLNFQGTTIMTTESNKIEEFGSVLTMTTSIVSAFLSNNAVQATHIPEIISNVHSTLAELNAKNASDLPQHDPAVPISKSITNDYLICLEDGRKLKMLKRHLRSKYRLTPEEYRARWGLPADYPMVAPNYAKRRSEFAKEIGLGRKKKTG